MSAPRLSSIALIFAAVSCCLVSTARASSAPELRLSVAVCAPDQVPPELVAAAERIAEDVYRDIGVGIEWRGNRCEAGDTALEVNLITRDHTDEYVSDETIGFAESGTAVATVLYDRVFTFSRRFRVRPAVLLGYAMAHEIGHLLLPPHSHSPEGVMCVSIDLERASARKLRFTQPQGELIVRRLASR